jgi:hypothetical protein
MLLLVNMIFSGISTNIEIAAFCSNYHTYGENLDNYGNNYHTKTGLFWLPHKNRRYENFMHLLL